MNFPTNKTQSMLKCSNCLSVPLIQSLSLYAHSSYIQYECKCGKRNTFLNTFLKYCVYQLKNNDSIVNDDSQMIYCMLHDNQKMDKQYCNKCKIIFCPICDQNHEPHEQLLPFVQEEEINQTEEKLKENKEKFYSRMLENKELILKEINETIFKLNNDKKNIINAYNYNKRTNDSLYYYLSCLINSIRYNRENSNNYINYLMLSEIREEKKEIEHKSIDLFSQIRAYNPEDYPLDIDFEYQRRQREPFIKSLDERIDNYINQCNSSFLIYTQKTKLSNLQLNNRLFFSSNKCNLFKESIVREEIQKILISQKSFTSYFLTYSNYPVEINLYSIKEEKFGFGPEHPIFNNLREPQIIEGDPFEFLIYDRYNHFYLVNIKIKGVYRLPGIEETKQIIKLSTGGYLFCTKDALFYTEELKQEASFLFETKTQDYCINIMEYSPYHILICYTTVIDFYDIEEEIALYRKNMNCCSNICILNEMKIAIWDEKYIEVFNCKNFQTETTIEFMQNTGIVSHMLNVDGILLVSETNKVYRVDLDTYKINKIIQLNDYYAIRGIVAAESNIRKIAIIEDLEILFYTY